MEAYHTHPFVLLFCLTVPGAHSAEVEKKIPHSCSHEHPTCHRTDSSLLAQPVSQEGPVVVSSSCYSNPVITGLSSSFNPTEIHRSSPTPSQFPRPRCVSDRQSCWTSKAWQYPSCSWLNNSISRNVPPPPKIAKGTHRSGHYKGKTLETTWCPVWLDLLQCPCPMEPKAAVKTPDVWQDKISRCTIKRKANRAFVKIKSIEKHSQLSLTLSGFPWQTCMFPSLDIIFSFCPQLARLYPNMNLELQGAMAFAPFLNFSPGNLSSTPLMEIEGFVLLPSSVKEPVFRLGVVRLKPLQMLFPFSACSSPFLQISTSVSIPQRGLFWLTLTTLGSLPSYFFLKARYGFPA